MTTDNEEQPVVPQDPSPPEKERGKEKDPTTTKPSNGDDSKHNDRRPDEPPPRKKRSADRQITKDDDEEEEDDGTDNHIAGPFARASQEVLNRRKILKAKRPLAAAASTGKVAEEEEKKNPFAAVTMTKTAAASGSASVSADNSKTTSSSVFGSTFASGAFGVDDGKPHVFGSSASSGFGSGGFGSFFSGKTKSETITTSETTKDTGNGSEPHKFLFGSSAFGDKTTETSDTTSKPFAAFASSGSSGSATQKKAVLPEQVDLVTGEEEEECIYTVRAKAFCLADDEEHPAAAVASTAAVAHGHASVPPSSSSKMSIPTHEKEEESSSEKQEEKTNESFKEEEGKKSDEPSKPKEGKGDDDMKQEKDGKAKQEDPSSFATKEQQPQKHQHWREVGIGPLKVLKSSSKDENGNHPHYRVVQRRESTPGGAIGTKLLLNFILTKDCQLSRPSEKHLQLSVMEPPCGKISIYLFRVKMMDQAQELQTVLQDAIDQSMPIKLM